jgi:hypothetical protein
MYVFYWRERVPNFGSDWPIMKHSLRDTGAEEEKEYDLACHWLCTCVCIHRDSADFDEGVQTCY